MTVKFNATKEELLLIGIITKRAMVLLDTPQDQYMNLFMDIQATHSNGCKLNLQKLHDADDFNLLHDVCGIANHINRENGQLERCFLPRCSA